MASRPPAATCACSPGCDARSAGRDARSPPREGPSPANAAPSADPASSGRTNGPRSCARAASCSTKRLTAAASYRRCPSHADRSASRRCCSTGRRARSWGLSGALTLVAARREAKDNSSTRRIAPSRPIVVDSEPSRAPSRRISDDPEPKADGAKPKADGSMPRADDSPPRTDGSKPGADDSPPRADGSKHGAADSPPSADGSGPHTLIHYPRLATSGSIAVDSEPSTACSIPAPMPRQPRPRVPCLRPIARREGLVTCPARGAQARRTRRLPRARRRGRPRDPRRTRRGDRRARSWPRG